MLKKLIFPIGALLLAWGIFSNPTIKVVAAGVAILLLGMFLLEQGFKAFVEGPLRKLLKRATNKLYKSLGLGLIVTAFLQSSSLISVIAISFISAGLIGLHAGIGIIFGANIGTAATSWLVSIFGLNFDISALSMPMLAFGVLFAFQKSENLKGIGRIMAGLGFFFLGIHYMKEGFEVYQDSINLAEYAMEGIAGVVVFTLIGVLLTVILQSSSAAMALVLTALAAGQVTYGNSLALAIGANIGTTITAVLGALGSNIAGRRLAGAHLIFNVVTGFIALVLIVQLEQFVDYLAVSGSVAPDNYPIKLSIFHTVFNIIGVLVMVPLINPLVRFLNRILVEKEDEDQVERPKYLNDSVMAYPETAARALLDESKRLFEGATFEVVAHGINLHRGDVKGDDDLMGIIKKSRTKQKVDIEEKYYKKVKLIYGQVNGHAVLTLSKFTLAPEDALAITRIQSANRNIVDILHDIRTLRININQYMLSDNKYIQEEYDKLRFRIAEVLREIYAQREDSTPESRLKVLALLKENAIKSNPVVDGTLHNLMEDQKISSSMATSLAHDSGLVVEIIERIVETGELLYVEVDTHLKLIEQESAAV